MNDTDKGYLLLFIYSIITGFVGIIVKLIRGIDAYSIVFLRAVIAASFILTFILSRKKLSELRLVSPLNTILMGLFDGLSVILYFLALMLTNVSNALFLVFAAPVFSAVFARLFLKEKIGKETILGICVVMVGITVMLDPRTFSFASKDTLGSILALLSGVFYAAMAVCAKPLMKKVSGYYSSFWDYLVISLMFVLFIKPAQAPAIAANWIQLLVLGVVCSGIAVVIFMEGVKRVPAQKVFILTSLSPVIGTLFAAIILKETPSILVLIGGAIILAGIYLTTRKVKSAR
jgi:drug/metabolite transporter (DMT)-like permease